MKQLNLFLKILLCVLLTACVVLLSVNLFSRAEEKTPILSEEDRNDEETPANYAKVAEIVKTLDTYFVDDFSDDQLGDYLAEAVIASTGDRWSYYISAEDYDSYMEQSNNAYVGIGVTIEDAPNEGGVRVIAVTHTVQQSLRSFSSMI